MSVGDESKFDEATMKVTTVESKTAKAGSPLNTRGKIGG